MIVGDVGLWSDVFPGDLVPRIVDLILETWQNFASPAADELEVPITLRFKHALKQGKDLRCLPVQIRRESPEDDPLTGQELGRIDLRFTAAGNAREEVYFAFECKRLNAFVNGRYRALASEYVAEGMMRFVSGQYAASLTQGGMIGYVLDGRSDVAVQKVKGCIERRRPDLKMADETGLGASSLRPDVKLIRETKHRLSTSRTFQMHHLFLPCNQCRRTGKCSHAGTCATRPQSV